MNEHEKLEEALDLLEGYVHGNGINRHGENKITLATTQDCAAAVLLAECGRFRITEQRRDYGIVSGYWRDEDPERKAAS